MTNSDKTTEELVAEIRALREQLAALQNAQTENSASGDSVTPVAEPSPTPTQARGADRQLEIILRDVADGITAQGPTGQLIYANDAAARLSGYPSAETFLAAPLAEVVKQFEMMDENRQPLPLSDLPGRLALQGVASEKILCFRVLATGEERWSVVKATPVFDDEGRVQFAINIFRDFTERKKLEDELLFLTEASTVLASSLDYETTLQRVAQLAVSHLADWCVVDIVGEGDNGEPTLQRVAVAHVDPAKMEWANEYQRRYPTDLNAPQGVGQVLRTGQPEFIPVIPEALLPAIARDAEHLELLRELGPKSVMIVPLVAQGRTLGALTLISTQAGRQYDPATLLLAEELARRAAVAVYNARLYEEAQNAIELRDHFLSIAAHELKTPITSLKGFTGLLGRRGTQETSLNERDQRAVRVIQEQTERLNRLVDVLLDVSRIQGGHLKLEWNRVDLAALAERLIHITELTLTRHTLSLIHPPEPVIVLGDELRLGEVLQNLLSNAIKYSPEGGTIQVRVDREGERAILAVSDQGIGIPPEGLPQLFTRFYRGANVETHSISGLGLGLYLVNEIVTLHEGTIEVTSRPGQGSTFCVYLPLASGLEARKQG